MLLAPIRSPPRGCLREGAAANTRIALLAGKALKVNSTAYIRHQGRLVRATERGRLTEYRQLRPDGTPQRWPRYYSRAEVLALRDTLKRDGFKPRAVAQGPAVRAHIKRAERDGLISLAAAAERKGVTVAAARRWVEKRKFGAVKIDNLWFFEEAQVDAYQRPARAQPPETVQCALCRESFPVLASRARKAREAAAAAGEDELLVFCPACWATPEARRLAHSRRVWRRGYSSPGRAAAITAEWADGRRDTEAFAERQRREWRSPKEAARRANGSSQARYGHPADERRVKGRALSRAQRNSDRSRSRREQEQRLRELWPTDRTVKQIAEDLDTTVDNVWQMRRRLGLPPRPRGRRSKKY